MREGKNVVEELWEILFNKVGSYEFKNEIVWRACEAIKTRNISKLEGKMTLFHDGYPNNLEECTAEAAKRFMEESGITQFVSERLQESMLDYLVADRYGCPEIETLIKLRAKEAISMSDITPLQIGINVSLSDGTNCNITSEEMEEKAKEIGLWEYVAKEIAKKLPKTEEEYE